MESSKKLKVTAADVALASLNLNSALMAQLAASGVLSIDQSNFVASSAASMCEGAGNPVAAELIRTSMPSSRDTNIMVEAMKQGIEIKREPRDE